MSIRRVLMDFLHDSISSTRISVLCLRRQQRSCSCHWRPLRTVVVVTLSVLLCCRSSLRLSSLQTNCVGRKVAWIHRHYHFLFLLHLKCSYMFRVITALGHGTFWRYLWFGWRDLALHLALALHLVPGSAVSGACASSKRALPHYTIVFLKSEVLGLPWSGTCESIGGDLIFTLEQE